MERRQFVRTTGLAAVSATTGLAGCSGGSDGESDGEDGGDGGSTSTPVQTETAEPTPTPGNGSLSVTDVDTDSVDERDVVLMDVTVENDDVGTRTGVVHGEAEVNDETYQAKRQVTVDGEDSEDLGLKFTYDTAKSTIVYSGTANIRDDQLGESDDPVQTDPADDVVVLETDADSADAASTIEVTTQLRNLVQEPREVTLVGAVDPSDNEEEFTNRKEIRVQAGLRKSETIDVEYESENTFVSYSYGAWIE